MAKLNYYKLGLLATSFVCVKSGLILANGNAASVDATKAKLSGSVKNAAANGHIIEIEEDEFNDIIAGILPEKEEITEVTEDNQKLIDEIRAHVDVKKKHKKGLTTKTTEELQAILDELND